MGLLIKNEKIVLGTLESSCLLLFFVFEIEQEEMKTEVMKRLKKSFFSQTEDWRNEDCQSTKQEEFDAPLTKTSTFVTSAMKLTLPLLFPECFTRVITLILPIVTGEKWPGSLVSLVNTQLPCSVHSLFVVTQIPELYRYSQKSKSLLCPLLSGLFLFLHPGFGWGQLKEAQEILRKYISGTFTPGWP